MREIIAALQVSIDGFIEGPHGELDWVETWEDPFGLSSRVDTCVLGAGMYPGYEHFLADRAPRLSRGPSLHRKSRLVG